MSMRWEVGATRDSGPGVLLDEGVGVVVVDRFEVLGLHAVPNDVGVPIGAFRHIANEVFDEDRVIVSAFGDSLFVGTFENAIEFAGGALFDELDEVFHPGRGACSHGKGDVAALVMGAAVADGL